MEAIDVNIDKLIDEMENFTGAAISGVIENVMQKVLSHHIKDQSEIIVHHEDLLTVIKRMKEHSELILEFQTYKKREEYIAKNPMEFL